MHYDVGAWNEWYVLFDDGQTGWLSEVGDLYAMTCLLAQKRRRGPKNFKSVKVGSSSLIFNGQTFIASDVRTIHYRNTDAQGELPFNPIWESSDRRGLRLATRQFVFDLGLFDFPMDSYFGRIVSLDSLKLENKRSDDEIRESAGRLKGEILSENCPHCGAPVHWPSGVTSFLFVSVLRQQFEHDKRYCCVDEGKCPKERTKKTCLRFPLVRRPSERYEYLIIRGCKICRNIVL